MLKRSVKRLKIFVRILRLLLLQLEVQFKASVELRQPFNDSPGLQQTAVSFDSLSVEFVQEIVAGLPLLPPLPFPVVKVFVKLRLKRLRLLSVSAATELRVLLLFVVAVVVVVVLYKFELEDGDVVASVSVDGGGGLSQMQRNLEHCGHKSALSKFSFLSISATIFNAVVRELADIALPLMRLSGFFKD